MKISILGSGWLGKSLAFALKEKKYHIKASNRTSKNVADFKQAQIEPFVIDLEKENTILKAFLESDVLIICLASKNIALFKKIIHSIEKEQLKKLIFISSTSVYKEENKEVFEGSTKQNSHLVQIEKLFLENKCFKTTILRFGGLFGYDRNPVRFISPNRKMKNPDGYVNLIHRDDCIGIIEQIIAQNIFGEVFNACASTHPNRKAFYTHCAQVNNKALPQFEENEPSKWKKINSQKLKKQLNYCFLFDDLMQIH